MLLVLLVLADVRMIFDMGVLVKELVERYRGIGKFLEREGKKAAEGKEESKDQKEEGEKGEKRQGNVEETKKNEPTSTSGFFVFNKNRVAPKND